jgi:alkylation response protein AidB-like acyl-CoA dehydrogenase
MQDVRSAAPALTTLSEEESMFRDAVRNFAESEIRPHVSAMDEAAQFRPDLIPKFFELGLMGIEVPEPYGGAGGTIFMSVLAIEELARVDASAAIYVDVQNTLVNNAFLRWGNDEQQRRYFPRLTTELLGAFALSEPGSGSDAFALATRAERAGDGWEVTGRKFWITNGAEAGAFIVFANADPTKGYKGITAFIVERDFPGFSVGKKENKLGIRASSTTELILEQCRVPDANVLGPVGQGYKIAIETLNEGRIGIGAQMIGVATGALEAATSHVKERRQFGKAIAEFQGVQFQLAQMATDLEAARLMVYNAARLKDAGLPFAQQAAMAKLFSSQVADRTTSNCLELFGGYGYSKEYPAEKYYRDAKIGTIYEGTSNMQLQTIAKVLLK